MSWTTLVNVCVAADEADSANLESLVELIEQINEPTPNGKNTPLHFVALGTNIQLAQWLLENGAVFQSNENGESPLHWACKSECIQMVELFLYHMNRKEITQLDLNEDSCMDWAKEYKNKEALQLLRCTNIFPEKHPSKLKKLINCLTSRWLA